MSTDLPDELLDIDVENPEDEPEREIQSDRSPENEPDEVERFVVFRIGEQRLAVSVDAVKSIVKVKEWTRVPRTSPAIDGIMDLRGEITAVIEPRVHFTVEQEPSGLNRQRIIVFDRASDKQGVGIRVDDVMGVELVPLRSIVPSEHAEDEAGEHPLVTAVIYHEEDGQVVDTMGLLDIKGLIQASGQGAQ
ncbi:chemotaxis protein CheW [Haloarchaeobius sp. HME9146]|uniref:chemotaxis protein CheW n=1 Tax=Haloarchaeobius sp. HME9146 TaxID=2978732 RepID=UPI0021BF8064|nr:chemotaxis protein CheW [Haloarchaeobius sp. HME9146]MCT9096426.1 chemotaxis protein CheW [Haloarchaeobius sp. HME9146]